MSLGALARAVVDVLPATASGVRVSGDYDRAGRDRRTLRRRRRRAPRQPPGARADVYVTSDLRHHPASEFREQVVLVRGPALIDTSHWATEWLWLDVAAEQLRRGDRRPRHRQRPAHRPVGLRRPADAPAPTTEHHTKEPDHEGSTRGPGHPPRRPATRQRHHAHRAPHQLAAEGRPAHRARDRRSRSGASSPPPPATSRTQSATWPGSSRTPRRRRRASRVTPRCSRTRRARRTPPACRASSTPCSDGSVTSRPRNSR